MNIRKRLVTWHAIILAVFLLIFTIGLYLILNFHLYAEVDGSLESWATHSIEYAKNGDIFADCEVRINSNHTLPHFNLLDSFVLVFHPNEKIATEHPVLAKRNLIKLQQFLRTKSPNSRGSYASIILDSESYRIYYKAIPGQTRTEKKILVLGRSLMHVRETLSGLVITLILAWILAVIACSIISWIFVGRTLHPVKMMTEDALKIAASGELGRRIENFAENDEFGKLSGALNRMLLSLEVSSTTQKKFLADASHELRTPLTSIKANLEYMKRATKAPENDRLAALTDSITETDRMAKLVNELLMLARTEAPVSFLVRRIDMVEMVKEIITSYQIHQVELKRIIFQELSEPAMVNGDPDKLHQVIVILLDNALKYSPVGSDINLKISQPKNLVQFEITDHGPGIPEAEIELVFGRFYRASNVRSNIPGSGLGLAIVKSILDKQNGKIELRNIKPQGLTVTITLPAID